MNTWTKRGTMIVLAALMIVVGIAVPHRKMDAAIMYNNVTYVDVTCNINESGYLQSSLTASGIKGKTTRIKVELYVEKRIMGLFWTRVNIGYPNNIWEDSTTSTTYNNTFSYSLSSNGTYRVTATFTVSGSGGADDIITVNAVDSY